MRFTPMDSHPLIASKIQTLAEAIIHCQLGEVDNIYFYHIPEDAITETDLEGRMVYFILRFSNGISSSLRITTLEDWLNWHEDTCMVEKPNWKVEGF